MLDDAALRSEISLQDRDAAVRTLCVVEAVDDILAAYLTCKALGLLREKLIAVLIEAILLQLFQVLTQRLSGNGHHIQMQHGLDLFHDTRHAACIIEVLCRPVTGRTDVQQIVRSAVHPVEGIRINFNSEFMSNGREMHRRVRGARDCRMYHNGILKAFLCHNVSCLDSLSDKLHQLLSRIISSLPKLGGRCRHQSGSRQHQAKCLCHNLHGRSGSHKRACAAAGAGMMLVIVQLAVRNHAGLLPGIKLADLLQRQQFIDRTGRILHHIFLRQGVCLHDTSRHHNSTHLL